jgi:glycosyltransferase involved in cell wall biosynthesis
MLDKREPVISVVMAVYNEKIEWLHESIESILQQTFSDFEFIIINDNPTRVENSLVLQEYQKKDNRIIVITNEQNIGPYKSANKGIKLAKGKYIARMDADDISLPMRFEVQLDIMEKNPNIIVCGSKIEVFGEFKHSYYIPLFEKSNDIKKTLIIKNVIPHSTVMIRKDILINNNILYSENYIYGQDYKLWLDLYDYGDFYNAPRILLRYRTSESHITYQHRDKQAIFLGFARREYINKTLKEKGNTNNIDWDCISISTIRDIKQYKLPYNMIAVFYLSMKSWGIKEFFYFIFSFDYIHFPFRSSMRVIICFFQRRFRYQ